jgi:hypothetical protein
MAVILQHAKYARWEHPQRVGHRVLDFGFDDALADGVEGHEPFPVGCSDKTSRVAHEVLEMLLDFPEAHIGRTLIMVMTMAVDTVCGSFYRGRDVVIWLGCQTFVQIYGRIEHFRDVSRQDRFGETDVDFLWLLVDWPEEIALCLRSRLQWVIAARHLAFKDAEQSLVDFRGRSMYVSLTVSNELLCPEADGTFVIVDSEDQFVLELFSKRLVLWNRINLHLTAHGAPTTRPGTVQR